jgi:anti-anti-sigma factor
MALQVRLEGGIAILNSLGRLMNDPRYVDASKDVKDLLSQDIRAFIIELRGLGEISSPLLGLLMTITRQIRQHDGEVVLAGVSRDLEKYLDDMRLEDFWDVFRSVQEAKGHFVPRDDADLAR